MEKKNEQFDRVVREKLGKLQAPFDPDSWQLLEQRLEEDGVGAAERGAPLADSRGLDEILFEKLHRYEAPYRAGHWHKMEALLEETFTWPRSVLRYKLAELALMALLVLAFWQNTPGGAPFGKGPQAWGPGAGEEPVAPAPASKAETAPAPSAAQASAAAAGASRFDQQTMGGGPASPQAAETAANAAPLKNISLSAAGLQGRLRWRQLPELPGKKFFLPAIPPAPGSNPPAGIYRPAPMDMEFLEAPAPGLLAYEPARVLEEASIRRHRLSPVLRVGMFGSGDYNHVMVPPSEEKRISQGFDRYAMGYGGGLSLGLELGRWELESGAIYAARLYPVGLVYVNGSLADGLEGSELRNSELNILNVPLHLRYNVLHRGNWRAYALAGGALQVAFQSNFYTADAPEYSYRPITAPPDPAPGDEGLLELVRKNGRGWFEGGAFGENAYLTGNLGVGLERYIDTRWSIFAQPTLQYSLHYFGQGLGPNNDRINSLSVFFGAKVRLR